MRGYQRRYTRFSLAPAAVQEIRLCSSIAACMCSRGPYAVLPHRSQAIATSLASRTLVYLGLTISIRVGSVTFASRLRSLFDVPYPFAPRARLKRIPVPRLVLFGMTHAPRHLEQPRLGGGCSHTRLQMIRLHRRKVLQRVPRVAAHRTSNQTQPAVVLQTLRTPVALTHLLEVFLRQKPTDLSRL